MTGAAKAVREYIGNETFCFTYGDSVSNVNIQDLINFHKQQNTFNTNRKSTTRTLW